MEEELGRRALFKSFNEETLARFYTLGSSNDDPKMTYTKDDDLGSKEVKVNQE